MYLSDDRNSSEQGVQILSGSVIADSGDNNNQVFHEQTILLLQYLQSLTLRKNEKIKLLNEEKASKKEFQELRLK
ncbi:hypothetical protein M0813_03261 [Anaeramoeba flamelloides]|uniref:Uncharacterized protein n=1 Tax=Anaeramoeba flamelloides TaxID=1746091 RepID=A0ABQ8XZK1_9EUKA|nr:hypothetical protein M0813_03261 [Anaeramoeba flamelloides]